MLKEVLKLSKNKLNN